VPARLVKIYRDLRIIKGIEREHFSLGLKCELGVAVPRDKGFVEAAGSPSLRCLSDSGPIARP
jgi:hypothetical protein